MIKLLFFLVGGSVILASVAFWLAQQPALLPANLPANPAVGKTTEPSGVSLAAVETVSETVSETASEAASIDSLTRPPTRQTFTNGAYQLEIAAKDSWRSPSAVGKLYKNGKLLWQKDLPHQYGPRFSLVSPSGQVVLFDEYINVASLYAIALISPTGRTTRQYSFDDIKQALPDVAPADFTRQAASGWWISSLPTLAAAGNLARVETGGTTLELDLATGELSRSDNR